MTLDYSVFLNFYYNAKLVKIQQSRFVDIDWD